MKVLHVPYTYYPDPVGGTEVYVEALSRQLRRLGFAVSIAAPSMRDDAYEHGGIRVRRYGTSASPSALKDLYGEGDEAAAHRFNDILATERPDILHLHAFTRGVSLRLVRVAKTMRVPVVFTYHTPTVTCQRGTMMKWGTETCDGLMNLVCSRCAVDGLLNRWRTEESSRDTVGHNSTRILANLVGSLSPSVGALFGQLHLQGRV